MPPVTTPTENKALIERFWGDLARRDFDAVGSYFTADGHYTDVPAPEEGAYGPAEVSARLRLGLEPLAKYELHDGPIVADGDMVITEHSESWYWESGESVTLPFVSVHEIRDGQIVRWHDYFDLSTLLSAAPEAWMTHIMVGYK
ncbi:MAG: nuclear transport factor 2 family protein [Acidimicrobiia bacterium]|nr:nuclear transport factor 2 family protein [Acidimicrobiia bacterium]